MKNLLKTMLLAVILAAVATAASAAPLKAYVAPFTVTGAPNREELKGMLPTLLASRLNTESVVAVDTPAGADLTVSGSYIFFGGVFSIDVAVRRSDGSVVTRAFEQGESAGEVIPLMKKLGSALGEQIAKAYPVAGPLSVPAPVAAAAVTPAASGDIVRPAPVRPAEPAGEIIRPAAMDRAAAAGWVSKRLDGEMRAMAPGRKLANGEQEIFIATTTSLRYYRQGAELKLVAQADIGRDQEILALDTADLDDNGAPEIYVTVMAGEQLSSQVWLPVENRIEKAGDRLPYFFRSVSLTDGRKRVFAQQMGREADFFGDVAELVKNGSRYEVRNPIKLPRFGNLYNFGQMKDAVGNLLTLVMNDDGYIIVYDAEGAELWRTSDKFGGSEVAFKRDDTQNMQFTGSRWRVRFLEQRMTVLPTGEVLVPQNSGTFVAGNQRSYKKSTVFALAWNGSSLEERWHLKESPSYLADYTFDADRKELLLLQVVKKGGITEKGASVLAIKKIE